MENFNKNWLAILLIVFVFFGLGFLFGWVLKPNHHPYQKHMMMKHKMQKGCCPSSMHSSCSGSIHEKDVYIYDDAALDSLEDINIEVIMDEDGNITTNKENVKTKVIVKKIEE